jgi:hypothetical protein
MQQLQLLERCVVRQQATSRTTNVEVAMMDGFGVVARLVRFRFEGEYESDFEGMSTNDLIESAIDRIVDLREYLDKMMDGTLSPEMQVYARRLVDLTESRHTKVKR